MLRNCLIHIPSPYPLPEEAFADVHIVRGGMTKWLDAGLPVAR